MPFYKLRRTAKTLETDGMNIERLNIIETDNRFKVERSATKRSAVLHDATVGAEQKNERRYSQVGSRKEHHVPKPPSSFRPTAITKQFTITLNHLLY